MKPYYEQDGIIIYHADCRDVLPTLPANAADLALTDPPYNAGMQYGQHNDVMPIDDYAKWCSEWFSECRRISTRVIIFPGHGNLPIWWHISKPSGVGCWYKPGNPAGGGVFQWCEWEPWLLYGGRIGGSDVVRATVHQQRYVGDHPCPKPLNLFTKIIAKTKAETIIDPFMGSGTTLRAAKDLGRKAIGIEIEEKYIEVAIKRLQQSVLPFEIAREERYCEIAAKRLQQSVLPFGAVS